MEALMSWLSIRAIGFPVLLLVLGACSKNARSSARDTAATGGEVAVAAAPGGPVVLTVAARPGEAVYLTDAAGRAVYYIASPDGAAAVECTGECTTAFDPVTGKAIVATGDTTVKVSLIGEVKRPDGSTQVTYDRKPLYYHRGDQASGAPTGNGKKAGGGEASLVSPDGNKATRK
jgi:predicted lipoprotein with Yx(FWY)xxD motif